MSFKDKYEYIQGEYADVSREQMSPSGSEAAWMIDTNGIKIAGYQIILWSADTGGTQLIEGTDYSLTFQDTEKTSVEGVDIWAGYIILNPAYQVIPLFMDIRMIGGYTKLIPDSGVIEVPSSPGVVKDWLNVFDGPPAIKVFNNWGEGRFHVTVGYEYKGDYYESDTDIDITNINVNKYEILAVDLQGSDSIISIGFRGETTGEFEVLKRGSDFTLYTIIKIDLWSDMGTGYVVPIQDGWVGVYDDPGNTSPVPVADITGWGSGEYGVELINSAGDARYSTSMRIESLNTDTYSADVGTSTAARVIYDQAAGTLSCEDSALYIIKIYRFIGLMNVQYTPAQEDFPPFDFSDKGDPLKNGELIGDGSLSLISSSGRIPIAANVEMIPGRTYTNGVGSYDPFLKWQGRAIYGVFAATTNKWQYSMDWALSTEWTVEGWFYNTGDTSHTEYLNVFHTAEGAVDNRWSVYFSPGERVLRLYSMPSSGGSGLVIGTPSVGWNHVKILWESGTRFRGSLNGAAYTELTSNVLTTADCNKIVTLGSFGDETGYLDSYLTDWMAVGGIDESHDHFLKDEPYYDTKKQYGKDALWSIDYQGHIASSKGSASTTPLAELPVGFVYTQYPGKPSPVDLLLPGTWANITAEFADNFFRAEGPKTAPFDGSVQEDQMQQITGGPAGTKFRGTPGVYGALIVNDETSECADNGSSGGGSVSFDSANSPNARTGTETRPTNQTIRIWERTA